MNRAEGAYHMENNENKRKYEELKGGTRMIPVVPRKSEERTVRV